MRVICIRTCYIRDHYFEEGNVYELPDDFPLDHLKRLDKLEAIDIAENKIKTTDDFWTCPHCGKQFRAKIALAGHMRSHLKKKGGNHK